MTPLDEIEQALKEALGHMTGGLDGTWSHDKDPAEMLRQSLAHIQKLRDELEKSRSLIRRVDNIYKTVLSDYGQTDLAQDIHDAAKTLSDFVGAGMSELALVEKYDVCFVNNHEDYEEPLKINFTAYTEHDVRSVIEALSILYSGDPYECFINGERAVLEKDWGLA